MEDIGRPDLQNCYLHMLCTKGEGSLPFLPNATKVN